MALSVPPAPLARARAVPSMFSDGPSGGKLRTAFVLARTSLWVLMGRASVNAACGEHDRHPVEHGYKLGRPVDVVLAGGTDAVTGQRCFLVIGQDDDLAAFIPAQKAVTDDVRTASTLIDDALLQPQRPPSVGPLVQQECAVAQGAVDRSRAPNPQASPEVLPRKESTPVTDHFEPLDWPVQTQGARVLGVRRATSAAATQTVSSTLVVAGLMGLLGVCRAAASIADGVTGPVSRAVRVLRASEKSRRRPTIFHELRELSPAVHAAGDDPLGGAREIRADGWSISAASETRSAVTVVANVVRQVHLVALDATIQGARFGGADPSFGVIASREGKLAEEAADALIPGSPPAASSMATPRYAAARSRAIGPTTDLWHAVDFDRLVGAIGGTCETTVCGSLVRVSTDQRWPVPARDVCPTCSTLAH